MFHFKIFKIQFQRVPSLHHVLICKIPIYMPKMTLSNLLTYIHHFSSQNLLTFYYITCFVPNLIPTRPQSHRLLTNTTNVTITIGKENAAIEVPPVNGKEKLNL